MTDKIVSLSRARKSRARDDQRRQADANAAKHGQTRAEREAEAARKARHAKHLDGHQKDDG